METRVFSDLYKVPDIEGFWRRCIHCATGDIFTTYSYDWINCWWKHIYRAEQSASYKPAIIAVFEGSELVGILPAMVYKYRRRGLFPYRIVYLLCHGITDYADLIIDYGIPAERRTKIIEHLLSHLNSIKYSWDEARLDLIPESSPNYPILNERLKADRRYRFTSLPTTNLLVDTSGDWNDFIKTRGRDVTNDVKRRINKLERTDSYEFKCTREIGLDDFLIAIKGIHSRRQAALGRQSFLESECYESFVQEVFRIYHCKGILDYCVLILGGAIIAYMVGFKLNGVRHSWNVGFDPQYQEMSPGKVLLYLWIKEAFENPEITEFNFMRGDAPFKRKWTHEARYTLKLRFRSPNIYSQLMARVRQ